MEKSYKKILVGINGVSRTWSACLKKLNKPNVILCDFSDELDLKNGLLKNVDYILPLSRPAYENVSYLKNKKTKAKILCPSNELFDKLNSKILFIHFMTEYFPDNIPEVYYLENVKIKEIEFPVVSKAEFSFGGKYTYIYKNEYEFVKCSDRVIVQKCIDEEYEYGAHMLCIDGKIVNKRIIRFKYPKYTVKTDNFPANYETVINFNMDVFDRIVEKLDYSGGICIDFKLDGNNIIKIFEINPRFGGSAFTTNFIYELLCMK